MPCPLPRDSEGNPKKASFLPLEAFDPSPELDLAALIEANRDPSDGRCYAYSKWAIATQS